MLEFLKDSEDKNSTMTDHYIESSWSKQDANFEMPLRPDSIDSFIGQDAVRERLNVHIGAAKQRNEPLGHLLFFGPPGLGKTTLSYIIAKAMGTNLSSTSGPILERPGDLAGVLTNLKKGDVLFIDEIHRLPRQTEEYLYSAMEDFTLDLLIDSGPNARSVQVTLEPFTLVGATTRSGFLSSPLRSRFASQFRLDFYPPEVLKTIILRSSRLLAMNLEECAALEVAKRARGTPRIANNLLRWVRDFAQMKNLSSINLSATKSALQMLSIDEKGLDEMDIKILSVIQNHYNGGPVGIQTIAVAVGEEPTTIAEVYEPYLIMQGFLRRTPRGRELTNLAYEHLGLSKPKTLNHGDKS